MTSSCEWRAGARALAHLHARGLKPEDVSCVPAAAGGPKGLALIPLDRLLFGEWLRDNPRLELVGASIGAWRMAAASVSDAARALARVCEAYVGQVYSERPSPEEVSAGCRDLARAALDGQAAPAPRAGVTLSVLTARARGALAARSSRTAFLRAAVANALGRARLGRYFQRVVFEAGAPARLLAEAFDAFDLERVPLGAANAEAALLASGSIPLICAPVSDPPAAPPGHYWDGGVIDYHLLLPFARLPGVVFYPHFVPEVTPGWLDKQLPWRRGARGHPWLDNVLLVAPSRALLARLPGGRLPDRHDFYRFGRDHAARRRAWLQAIAECERFADEVRAWLERPRLECVQPL